MQFADIVDAGLMRPTGDCGKERPGIAAPAAIRTFVVRNQRTRQLLDVVGSVDLAEQVPFSGGRLERIENDVAALRPVKAPQVSAIRIRDHRAVATGQAAVKKFA